MFVVCEVLLWFVVCVCGFSFAFFALCLAVCFFRIGLRSGPLVVFSAFCSLVYVLVLVCGFWLLLVACLLPFFMVCGLWYDL